MRRIGPRSLAGQMALLLGLALLVAQLINLGLILNERQKASLAQNEVPALTRFADVESDLAQAAPEFRGAILADNSHRGARFALQPASGITEAVRVAATEERLAGLLAQDGAPPATVRAAISDDTARSARDRPRTDIQILRLALLRGDGQWLTARMTIPRRDGWFAARLALATALLYLIVLGASIWMARRIARPLRNLTLAAERFAGRTYPAPVAAHGPADLRLAITAFNAMNARVVGLLDEKDRMLGAIGHDLRTPLASLRIRVENMDPEEERDAAIAKIAEMTAMLEDILVLARSGRAREESREMDVAALAEALAEDYRDGGAAVRFVPADRMLAPVQPVLLRRGLRNLIDNALTYAGGAEVAIAAAGGSIEISVTDHGPGIPPDQLEQVLEPFYRLEASRNRASGGSGLGLAIARSIAESHGGTLRLAPAEPMGLIATIALPV